MPDPNQSKSVYDLLIGIKLSPGATVLMINPLFYLDIEGKALTKSEAENIKNITNDIITAVPSGIIVEGTFHPFPSTSTPRPENTQALILDVSTGTPTPTVTPTATITATFPAYPGP